MSKSLAFFRGKIVPSQEANSSISTHALHYGTGGFEGIRGNWNSDHKSMYVFRMKEHYERLLQGCKIGQNYILVVNIYLKIALYNLQD